MDVRLNCGLIANKRARARSGAAAERAMLTLGIDRDCYQLMQHPLGGAWVFWTNAYADEQRTAEDVADEYQNRLEARSEAS